MSEKRGGLMLTVSTFEKDSPLRFQNSSTTFFYYKEQGLVMCVTVLSVVYRYLSTVYCFSAA